jgi:hypothetical protein
MSTWNPKLWRVASRLAARYGRALGERPRIYAPEDEWLELKERTRRLQAAECQGWTKAAAATRAGLLRDATTHPHVNDERLCPGEGRKAIHAALAEGRLFDFFTVVDRILHTYARGAAYVELNRWHGIPCRDCDDTIGEDESYTCGRCSETVCGNCSLSCESCSESLCSGCAERCERCEARHCSGCLSPCVRCRRDVCSSCADEGVCETCLEEMEDEAEAEAESLAAEMDANDAPTEPAV